MTGTFSCHGSAKVESYPTPDFIQYGVITGCHGTGDFEGMRMTAYITKEANPGLGGVAIHDFSGVVW